MDAKRQYPASLVELFDLIMDPRADAGVELVKRLEPVFKDAERYRWLRSGRGSANAALNQEGPSGGWQRVLWISDEYLDALIDVEIADQPAVGAA